jgi:hypothetical protein
VLTVRVTELVGTPSGGGSAYTHTGRRALLVLLLLLLCDYDPSVAAGFEDTMGATSTPLLDRIAIPTRRHCSSRVLAPRLRVGDQTGACARLVVVG